MGEAMHPAYSWVLYQLRECKLSASSLLVYLYLLSLSKEWEGHYYCNPPMATIVTQTGLGRTTVHRAVSDLSRRELVRVMPVKKENASQEPNVYVMSVPPGITPNGDGAAGR